MSFAYLGIKENGQYDSVIKKSIWLYWGIAIALYTLIVGLRENVGIGSSALGISSTGSCL